MGGARDLTIESFYTFFKITDAKAKVFEDAETLHFLNQKGTVRDHPTWTVCLQMWWG